MKIYHVPSDFRTSFPQDITRSNMDCPPCLTHFFGPHGPLEKFHSGVLEKTDFKMKSIFKSLFLGKIWLYVSSTYLPSYFCEMSNSFLQDNMKEYVLRWLSTVFHSSIVHLKGNKRNITQCLLVNVFWYTYLALKQYDFSKAKFSLEIQL